MSMWFIINGSGERCKVVNSEEVAIRLVENTEWYVDYVYSNEYYMC